MKRLYSKGGNSFMTSANELLIYLAVCRCAVSSGVSVLEGKISSSEDNAMKKCFLELKIELEKWDTCPVVVAGASRDQQPLIELLLGSFPCLVVEDPRQVIPASGLGPSTVVIQFLADAREDRVTKVVKALPDSRRALLLLIFEGPVDSNGIESALDAAHRQAEGLIFFAHREKKSVKFYSHEMKRTCEMGAQLITDWGPGLDLSKLTEFSKRRPHLRQCEQFVATAHSPPHVYLTEYTDQKMRVLQGTEGNLILTVSWLLHFVTVVEKDTQNASLLDTDYENEWIISKCASRETGMGVGQIRPNSRMIADVEICALHAREYIVWCVPRILRFERNVMTAEFTAAIWALIGLTFLVSIAMEIAVRNAFSRDRGGTNRSDFSATFLDVLGISLGNTVVHDPSSRGGKLLLILYLWYSTIVTTSFKTSLASIITVESGRSAITDTAGILRANLTTGGPKSLLYILGDQAEDDETTARLMRRYEVEEDGLRAVRRVSRDQNFAYLTKLSKLAYYHDLLTKLGETVSFDVLDDFVLTYGTVFVMPKRSRWLASAERIMSSVVESGIHSHRVSSNPVLKLVVSGQSSYSGGRNTTEDLRSSVREKFRYIFTVFTILSGICLVTFFGELICHRFEPERRNRRIENRLNDVRKSRTLE